MRAEQVRRFNQGEADVFLISLRAGGTGLNRTAADIVIHYDPWWNLAAQNQATDRAYRIGQRKAHPAVHPAHRLVFLGGVVFDGLRFVQNAGVKACLLYTSSPVPWSGR